MPQDITKHLERARRSLEKNKLREAAAEYQAVLEAVPINQEAVQALADIHSRLEEPEIAAQYYALQFDRLVDLGDSVKAAAIFTRVLRTYPQPPERLMRYAGLLQRQNRAAEAIEQYGIAAELFLQQHRDIEALACYENVTILDPETPSRHIVLGELAQRLNHADLAMRSYLRAGQMVLAKNRLDEAIDCFGRARALAPGDRNVALLLSEARLRKGDAASAVALLDPLAPSEKDAAFLALYGEALLRAGQLDRAREVFEAYVKQKPDSFGKLFEVATGYLKLNEEAKAVSLLLQLKDSMLGVRKEGELCTQMERLAVAFPASVPVSEIVARLYEDLNREAKYFDALCRLFDLYMVAGKLKEACEALDRLVDIDPYDYRNQQRISSLEGKVDPAFLQNILSRAAKAATVSTRTDGFAGAGSEVGPSAPVSDEVRAQQALDDLTVQVEIFLQYSLQTKAIERLERIAELFPGEEDRNERLRALYERANWWPKGVAPKAKAPAAPPPPVPHMVSEPQPSPGHATPSASETHRDLAAISEVNRLMYRQPSPREVLATTAEQVGKHLGVTRCLISMGRPGESGQVLGEFFAPSAASADTSLIPAVVSSLSSTSPDALGGIELRAENAPALRELGLESALGVILTDKETQAPAGVMIVGDARLRKWKPNESFFLQAVGDQLVLSVNHSRLRSLVRSLAVTDERTGLLSRGAYIDCLLAETNRTRSHGTRLSLIILQLDHGSELLRQHGDAALEKYIEQLARTLTSAIRQTDVAVKYTAWSLVFILPDTSLENAGAIAEKLRQTAGTVPHSWGAEEVTISAVVAEATSHPGDDPEDRVTEWINRAEAALDEIRHNSGNTLVPLATP
jgi:diguanylate cyclase (GGDEF)-like protein